MTAASSASHGQQDHHALEHVMDAIIDLGEKNDRVSFEDVKEEIGGRSFGPSLFVPAILELSPVGGIPGVPTLLAIIVVLTASQMLFGRKEFWIPDFIAKRSVTGERLSKGLGKMRPVLRFMDRIIRPRMKWTLKSPWIRVIAAMCVLCAIAVPPLEILPFASSVPFSAIALVGLGLIGRDGLFVLLGGLGGIATGIFVLTTLAG